MGASGLKQQAQTGFAAAAAYDAHRPSYPTEAVEELLTRLEINGVQNAKILDLAAGTGKLTEVLAARSEQFEILAVEPHDGMREELSNKRLPKVTVIKGTAEEMPAIPDGSVVAVVAAQSFHWFANMTALQEIARVLQPAGVLGMIWNIDDYNAPKSWNVDSDWERKMRDVIWTFDDNQPRFRHEKWRQVFDDQAKSDPLSLRLANPIFGLPLGEIIVRYESWLPKEDIWNRLRTLSQIAVLQGGDLEDMRKTFDAAMDSEETQQDQGGRMLVHGSTVIAWTSRIPGEPMGSGG